MQSCAMRIVAVAALSLLGMVWHATASRAAELGVAGGLSFGAEQALDGESGADLTLDGFVEVTFASGVYAGAAGTADAFADDADEEADLYVGYSGESGGGISYGIAYGLHFEDDEVECCGAVEASLGIKDDAGRALNATFGIDVDGDCCRAGVTLSLPAGRGTALASDLSYDDDDGAASASLSVTHEVSVGLTAIASAGRDGSDGSNFAEIGLGYEFGAGSDIDLTLRDTSTDAPSVALIYSVSFDTAQ